MDTTYMPSRFAEPVTILHITCSRALTKGRHVIGYPYRPRPGSARQLGRIQITTQRNKNTAIVRSQLDEQATRDVLDSYAAHRNFTFLAVTPIASNSDSGDGHGLI